MTPKDYWYWTPPRPPARVFPSVSVDFFGLDYESQDALLALVKVWRDRAATRTLLKVIGA
mgnify:CR=1 FL=1